MKFFLIFVLIIFLLGSFSKQILRYFLKTFMNKVRDDYERQMSGRSEPIARSYSPDGEIHVHYDTRPSAAKKGKGGPAGDEYVDFEEVK